MIINVMRYRVAVPEVPVTALNFGFIGGGGTDAASGGSTDSETYNYDTSVTAASATMPHSNSGSLMPGNEVEGYLGQNRSTFGDGTGAGLRLWRCPWATMAFALMTTALASVRVDACEFDTRANAYFITGSDYNGSTTTYHTDIDTIDHATHSRVTRTNFTDATGTNARLNSQGHAAETWGYLLHATANTSFSTRTFNYDVATDTWSFYTPSSGTRAGNRSKATCHGTSDRAYYSTGHFGATYRNEIDRYVKSTHTNSILGIALSTRRAWAHGFGNHLKGYWAGGRTSDSTKQTINESILYATDGLAVDTSLLTARMEGATSSSQPGGWST